MQQAKGKSNAEKQFLIIWQMIWKCQTKLCKYKSESYKTNPYIALKVIKQFNQENQCAKNILNKKQLLTI